MHSHAHFITTTSFVSTIIHITEFMRYQVSCSQLEDGSAHLADYLNGDDHEQEPEDYHEDPMPHDGDDDEDDFEYFDDDDVIDGDGDDETDQIPDEHTIEGPSDGIHNSDDFEEGQQAINDPNSDPSDSHSVEDSSDDVAPSEIEGETIPDIRDESEIDEHAEPLDEMEDGTEFESNTDASHVDIEETPTENDLVDDDEESYSERDESTMDGVDGEDSNEERNIKEELEDLFDQIGQNEDVDDMDNATPDDIDHRSLGSRMEEAAAKEQEGDGEQAEQFGDHSEAIEDVQTDASGDRAQELDEEERIEDDDEQIMEEMEENEQIEDVDTSQPEEYARDYVDEEEFEDEPDDYDNYEGHQQVDDVPVAEEEDIVGIEIDVDGQQHAEMPGTRQSGQTAPEHSNVHEDHHDDYRGDHEHHHDDEHCHDGHCPVHGSEVFENYDPDDDEEIDEEYPDELQDDDYGSGMDETVRSMERDPDESNESKTAKTAPASRADVKNTEATDNTADNKWMKRFTECTLKLNELKRVKRASSVGELGMSNRIFKTFVFVLMDVVFCAVLLPRKSVLLKMIWMAVWLTLTYLSFNSNQKSPLFIVLLVNAALPFLSGNSIK